MMKANCKRRYFRLPVECAEETVTTKLGKLKNFPGIIATDKEGKSIKVEYTLLECNYVVIKNYLHDLGLVPSATDDMSIRESWLIFCEQNEVNNMQSPAGWPQHLQKLYLALQSSNRKLSV